MTDMILLTLASSAVLMLVTGMLSGPGLQRDGQEDEPPQIQVEDETGL